MKTIFAACAASLVACASLQASAAPIDVIVTAGGPHGCTIKDVDDIHVKKAASIEWHVTPESQFKFAVTTGIEFIKKKDHQDPPDNEFEKQDSSDSNWVVIDHYKTKGKFGYAVHVVGKNDPTVYCDLDPTVFND